MIRRSSGIDGFRGGAAARGGNFTEKEVRGFRVAFYGFVKLLCDPIHILKLFDEALRRWEEWGELPDVLHGWMPDASQITALKCRNMYVGGWEESASRVGRNARARANTGVLRCAQNDKQKNRR
jgi:hypothetical protein